MICAYEGCLICEKFLPKFSNAGHHGNKLADQLAKEDATSRDINECYERIPKSTVLHEVSDHSETKRQCECDNTTKGAITKSFFPKIIGLKINVTPNFTTMVTGHNNINSYLHKYKIVDSPMCTCKSGEQTDHIFEYELFEQESESKSGSITIRKLARE